MTTGSGGISRRCGRQAIRAGAKTLKSAMNLTKIRHPTALEINHVPSQRGPAAGLVEWHFGRSAPCLRRGPPVGIRDRSVGYS